MDPHGPTARRFPLVARFRPACLPLPERVQALVALADTAHSTGAQGTASAVFNQAALIASDTGLPELARTVCHRHAAAYLHACPLPSMTAIRALEPVVNLARLQIRAGNGDDGRERLLRLYHTVRQDTEARFENITIPAGLVATPGSREEVRRWLWRVILADGARTLTTAGRWTEALAHVEEHHGVGKRMFDGRQIAILATLAAGTPDGTAALLMQTEPGEPWEQAVTGALTVLCRQAAHRPVAHHLSELEHTYLTHQAGHGTTVFDIRLGLTVLDTIGTPTPAAHRITEDLFRRTTAANDGYAAREVLSHPQFTELATPQQAQHCRDLVQACALGRGTLPANLRDDLAEALNVADHVIRRSLEAVT
ncbi:hypothetical protein GCM10010371_67250 [Streptomyces subrutilus]|uniref:Uncharacterized protein n=1 Tax=Streptomyces subrutilus TaxID=36818 RepID=A0A5P2UXR5_9ACTN|nr:hypothetical protein [Streptomyces subrutilus]QEU82274.1 hypothetical protein CP968_31970 [Streptomyces subrutilus]GGZ98086.1 hypothetical protein GCM10010371_67250 [Streptomyces subrutilus]